MVVLRDSIRHIVSWVCDIQEDLMVTCLSGAKIVDLKLEIIMKVVAAQVVSQHVL